MVYVPETVAQELGGAAGIGQVLVRYESGADADALDQRLTRLARDHQAALVVPRSEQPSNAVIGEEQTGFDEASIVVPGLVLLLAVAVGAIAASQVSDVRKRRRRMAVATGVGRGRRHRGRAGRRARSVARSSPTRPCSRRTSRPRTWAWR